MAPKNIFVDVDSDAPHIRKSGQKHLLDQFAPSALKIEQRKS